MQRANLLTLTCIAAILSSYAGCAYTVLRDFDAEARQAEYVAIDSLTSAPDLTISSIEYEYVPPPPRYGPLDREMHPAHARFYLTISNIGNASFNKSYLVVIRNCNSRRYPSNIPHGRIQNQNGDTIAANSSQEIELLVEYPTDSALYMFVLVTNPIIQWQLIEELERYAHDPPIPPLVREFRYDNNEASIIIPRLEKFLYHQQQQ